jgi:hypothetical protein
MNTHQTAQRGRDTRTANEQPALLGGGGWQEHRTTHTVLIGKCDREEMKGQVEISHLSGRRCAHTGHLPATVAKGRTPAYNILTSQTTPRNTRPRTTGGLVLQYSGFEDGTSRASCTGCIHVSPTSTHGGKPSRHYGFSSFSSGVPFTSQVMSIGSHRRKLASSMCNNAFFIAVWNS